MKRLIIIPVVVLVLGLTPQNSVASEMPPSDAVLVVDKCPEFCPPSNTSKWWKPFTPRVCAQVILPVPGKKDWFWTNSCKTNMVQLKKLKK